MKLFYPLKVSIGIVLFFMGEYGFGQQLPAMLKKNRLDIFKESKAFTTDSGLIIQRRYWTSCKSSAAVNLFIPNKIAEQNIPPPPAAVHPPRFISLHGNISYDFLYRSKLDQPTAQDDFQQHTEKVALTVLFNEKYPVKVGFTLRQSNSPYFKNFADLNFQFDPTTYRQKIKQEVIRQLPLAFEKKLLDSLQAAIIKKEEQLLSIRNWLSSPMTLQKIIEEKERQYAAQQNTDSSKKMALPTIGYDAAILHQPTFLPKKNIADKGIADSIPISFSQEYGNKKTAQDLLTAELNLIHQQSDNVKKASQVQITEAIKKVREAGNEKVVMQIAAEHGVKMSAPGKFEQRLDAVKTLSIGRNLVNYTELTAFNIMITGVNVAYNPSYYAAIAVGKVDYRFRDFFNKNIATAGQYLVLGRVGMGNIDKRALIFTAFEGRKNASTFSLSDSVSKQLNIVGYSLETIFKKDENTSISFEAAKSTRPVTGNLQTNKQLAALWDFSNQNNFAFNIKGRTTLSSTHTKLSGFYRKTGADFQSFSLFSYNTDQTSWLARADQFFMKDKIGLTGMLRRNDFTNPFADKTYQTSTVFKSLLLHLRFPKYPTVSLGYYPGTQLYMVNKEKLTESAYYLMNGSMAYSYFYKGTGMNSSLVYNQYFNKASDSGFVLYKGVSYYALQTIFFPKLQLHAGYAFTDQPELKFATLEAAGDYAWKQFLKIGSAIKYNKISKGSNYWGGRLQFSAEFKQLGRLQIQYEKSYLPTIKHSLFPIETARISWSKYF